MVLQETSLTIQILYDENTCTEQEAQEGVLKMLKGKVSETPRKVKVSYWPAPDVSPYPEGGYSLPTKEEVEEVAKRLNK